MQARPLTPNHARSRKATGRCLRVSRRQAEDSNDKNLPRLAGACCRTLGSGNPSRAYVLSPLGIGDSLDLFRAMTLRCGPERFRLSPFGETNDYRISFGNAVEAE